jgi:predicted branched-subunit amino acid permease
VRTARIFVAAVWEFVVGEDWRTAVGVVLALALTALIAQMSTSAWWVMPPAIVGLLALSIRRAAAGGSSHRR